MAAMAPQGSRGEAEPSREPSRRPSTNVKGSNPSGARWAAARQKTMGRMIPDQAAQDLAMLTNSKSSTRTSKREAKRRSTRNSFSALTTSLFSAESHADLLSSEPSNYTHMRAARVPQISRSCTGVLQRMVGMDDRQHDFKVYISACTVCRRAGPQRLDVALEAGRGRYHMGEEAPAYRKAPKTEVTEWLREGLLL